MTKALKTIMILTALVLSLLILMSCNDNGAGTELSQDTDESTTAQTTDTEGSATSETEEQTSADTKPDGIHEGKDSTDGWGEFKPV